MSRDPERRHRMASVFQERFGRIPTVWCRAPGRVDLMGSHTDYNLGRVLTLPIGLDAWMAARPRQDRVARLHSIDLDETTELDLDSSGLEGPRHWSHYVRGVARVLRDEGLELTGLDGVIHSTVPLGGGLSSSAALECVVATVLEALGGWELPPVRKALLCQRAENEFVGVSCGILDQYTSCLGKEGCALLLDCRDLSSTPVRIADGVQVMVCDTKAKRELAGSEYGQRRAQCSDGARRLGVESLRQVSLELLKAREGALPPEVARRCRFIVEENDRVPRMAAALRDLDRRALADLTAASFRGACDLYEIGAPAMHAMMRAMLAAPGVLGARQAGAGFGGCMVAFVEAADAKAFTEFVSRAYLAATGARPDVYAVSAAAGAGLLPAVDRRP